MLLNEVPTPDLKHVTSHIPLMRTVSAAHLVTGEAVNAVYCAWEGKALCSHPAAPAIPP